MAKGKSTKRHRSSRKRFDKPMQRLILGVLVLVLLGGVYFVQKRYHGLERIFHYNISLGLNYPVRGIDVSKFNRKIDYKKVADDGYTFVYIKSSEGNTGRDPMFRKNVDRASKAGLKVGAYHFFRMNRDGAVQARNFLASVKGVHLDLPLVIDVEDWGNAPVSRAVVNQRLRDCVKTIKDAGRSVMIYTNGDGKKRYYDVSCKGVDLWLCTFSDPDDVKDKGHVMQQYSHWGRVDGINGNVDLDVFMGSRREWNDWLDRVK